MLALVLATAALLGLVLGAARPAAAGPLAAAAGVATLGVALGWRSPAVRLGAGCCLACALAGLRVVLWPAPAADALGPLVGSDVLLEGQVQATPTLGPRSVVFRLAATSVAATAVAATASDAAPRPVAVLVQVVASPDGLAGELEAGDRVAATGRLTLPLPTAAAPARADGLRRQGVFSQLLFPSLRREATGPPDAPPLTPLASLAALRAAAAQRLRDLLPQPQAALASGLLLGGSAGMSPLFRQELRASGLSHLVAIDGYKQALVSGAVAAVAVQILGRRRSVLPILLVVAGYTLLAGAPAAAVRAGLMVGAAVVAGALGRVADPLTSVALAAAAMGLVQPWLLGDTGFQLTVAATLGVILIYPRVRPVTARLPRFAGDQVAITLAVTLATLPVTLAVFHETSLVSPLAHVAAVPLVGPIMLATALLLVLLVLPVPGLAAPVSWLVWGLTTALAAIVHVAASVPNASVFTGRLPPAGSLALALLLVAWGCAALPEGASLGVLAGRLGGPGAGRALTTALVAPALLFGAALGTRPDGLLHVTGLGTGRGRAVLVRGPDGGTVLVSDAAVDPAGLAALVGEQLDVWERSLSAVVVVAPDDEPLLAETVRRYPAAVRLVGVEDARLDLGDGAVLDVFADAGPGVSVSYGAVWLPVAGRPPPPTTEDSNGATAAVPRPREAAAELLSDGTSIWPADGGASR